MNKGKAVLEVKVEDSKLLSDRIPRLFCNLAPDPAGVTRPICSLNSDSVSLKHCMPCIVHFTAKLPLLYFAHSKGNQGIGCLPCAPSPLLTISSDSTC